jgi:hypothetical protein
MDTNLAFVSYLTNAIREAQSVPDSAQTFNDAQLVGFLNTVLHSEIVPTLIKTNEEYFVAYKDFTVDQQMINDASGTGDIVFNIPSDAYGMKLREVCFLQTNGGVLPIRIPRIQLETATNGGYSGYGYFITQNQIHFPYYGITPSIIRMYYLKKPAILVPFVQVALVTDINYVANQVVIAGTPGSGLFIGENMSFCSPNQPYEYTIENVPIVDINGLNVEFDPAVIAKISIGDYLCYPGQAPFAQYIPESMTYLLIQGAALKVVQSVTDIDSYKIAKADYDEMKATSLGALINRVVSEPKKIIVGNRSSNRYSWRY